MRGVIYDRIITVDTESNPDGSLYLVSLYHPELDTYKLFYNVEDYINYIYTLGNLKIYVHNFGDWDSYFLLTEDFIKDQVEILNIKKRIIKYTVRHEVTTESKTNNYLRYKKNEYYITYEDTLPKAFISLERFAKAIGEPYINLPDYTIMRTPGKPETWNDRKEIEEYALKDVRILWKLIESYRTVFGDHFDKSLTAGSLVWRETVYHEAPDPRFAYSNYRKIITKLSVEQDSDIRRGYMGGITTPFYNAGKVLTKEFLKESYPWFENPILRADDISSAYAWAQVRELPTGNITTHGPDDLETLKQVIFNDKFTSFFRVKFSYDKCDFPVIPKMNMISHKKYSIHSGVVEDSKADYMHTMLYGNDGIAVISSLDLRFAYETNNYKNLKFEIIPFDNGNWGYTFKLGKYQNIVDITEKYYDLKNNATDRGLREAYKSPLVNLYGKTGERVHDTEDKLNPITREIEEIELDEARVGRYSNVAVASTITSYVHHKLYEHGKKVGFINMLYCDTDSLFYVCEDGEVEDVPEELGTWANEINGVSRALFICPKKYILEDENKKRIKSASAGISKKDLNYNIDNWMNGRRSYIKATKIRVENGIYLEDKIVDVTASFFEHYDPMGV